MSTRGVLIVVALAAGQALLVAGLMPAVSVPLQADVGLLHMGIQEREKRLGRRLTPEEHEGMRVRFRDETLLLQYAAEAGLDQIPYVERRLIRKMRFLLSGRTLGTPDGELKTLYDANPQRFIPPGSDAPLPFEHVKAQLRAMLTGPSARAVIDERVNELARRYRIVIEEQ